MKETNWIRAFEKIGKERWVKLTTQIPKWRVEAGEKIKTVQTVFQKMENGLGNILEKRDKIVKLWKKGLTKNEKVSKHCWKCFLQRKGKNGENSEK